MTKHLFYILAILLFSCQSKEKSVTTNNGVNWISIEEAQDRNAANPKDLLVFVHANWCPKCERLFKESFADKKLIQELNNHFYPVLINAHEPGNIEFKGKQYGNPNFDKQKGLDNMNSYHELLFEIEAKSIPSIVFLDSELNVQGTEMGFKPGDELRSLMKMYNSKY